MFRIAFLTICCLICLVAPAAAQSGGSVSVGGSSSARDEQNHLERYRQEMLKDMRIKREETDFKQLLERAQENAQLGAELVDQFSRAKSLSPTEVKKLSRMEKLSRQIRGETGGSDDKTELENPPGELEAALRRLAELSDELNKKVEKMTRHEISAAVIQQANELLALIRHTRSFVQ